MVPWLATTVNFKNIATCPWVYRALRGTCRGERHRGFKKKGGETGDGNGDKNGESGPAGTEIRWERRIGEAGASGGGGGGGDCRTLVGYVFLYRTPYEWEGADYIRHLQHS